jgi:hypothetical protein
MNTVATGACPHDNISQDTTVDLKYSLTQWSKVPVHTTSQKNERHSVLQIWACDTSRPQWTKVTVHSLWYKCGSVILADIVVTISIQQSVS